MYIKELEIDNFKSFASKVNIPLMQGFTAVSGPNGSGKSNIIDSILFALSLRTARSLRSEQGVADLISNHNKRNEASVKVVFANDNGEEFSIRRSPIQFLSNPRPKILPRKCSNTNKVN